MEIIVKKDLLDELQAKGLCNSSEEADKLLQATIKEIGAGLNSGNKVAIEDFGHFATENAGETVQSIPSPEFLSKLALEKAEKALQMILHFIKEMVIKGYEIQIMDFASFRVEDKPARIVETAQGDKKMLPARKILCFTPEKKFIENAGHKKILFSPAGSFVQQLTKLKTSLIMFVVPRRDFFVKTIEYHFKKVGWQVVTAQSIEESKHLLANSDIYLFILDNRVQDAQAFCELVKCRKNPIPLIILYPNNTDLKKSKDFHICGDQYLVEPFEIKQLLNVADIVLRQNATENKMVKNEVKLKFPTMDKYIDQANDLGAKLFSLSGLGEDGQVTMCAAFREALANAAQHGNKHRRDKLLEVAYRLDNEKIIISVADSGFGFEWQKFVSSGEEDDAIGRARQRHREGRLGGLGIMLMLRCVDRVSYNETGNIITLTKYLKN